MALPGDKSISHRALLLNAVAEGEATVSGLSRGADVASTAACLRALGIEVEGDRVAGRGLDGLSQPGRPLDCGNSGTTMRLLAGLLAAQPFPSVLVGDASLSTRPMERVVAPLREMGARADSRPLRVGGARPLRGVEHSTAVPSAQVKSALLLAGLYAEGTTRVTEPAPSRDHTEKMLRAMGAPVSFEPCVASIHGPVAALAPLDLAVPGDISAAAFWLVAGALHPQALVRLPGVGVNPTRTALLDLLRRCGVRVEVSHAGRAGEEPVADLEVGSAGGELRPLQVDGAQAAGLIDEFPVLAVAATRLPGSSRVTGAGELRVKESDRIAAVAQGLRSMGADVSELADGWEIRGGRRLQGALVQSRGDHRVAMALAIAGLLADGDTEIEDADCVAISDPDFWVQLDALCSS